MGEDIKIIGLEIENNGTLVQIDFKGTEANGRIFVPMRDILKALNNYLYTQDELSMEKMGFEKIDKDAPVYGLLRD